MSQLDEIPRSRIGEIAIFEDPDTGKAHEAKIKDQTDFISDEDYKPTRRYWRGVELLEWKDGTKELRFCYKIRLFKNGKWIWVNGSQTSLHLTIDTFNKLYQQMKQKGWL